MDKDVITVYWAPAAFNQNLESWNMLYREPVPVKKEIHNNSLPSSGIRICPSVKAATKNLFSLKSAINDEFKIDIKAAEQIMNYGKDRDIIPVSDTAKLNLYRNRSPEYRDHYHYGYDLSWLLFADQPVEMSVSSPYAPPSSPLEGAFLAPGQMNVGKWYRAVNLEYITPKNSDTFSLKEDQDLIYLKFLTDADIVFKRYVMTDSLRALSSEASKSRSRFGHFKSLEERYTMSSKSNLPQIILSEIKKNLVED